PLPPDRPAIRVDLHPRRPRPPPRPNRRSPTPACARGITTELADTCTSERGIAPILYANHYTCPRGHLVSTYGHIVYPPESPYAQKKLGERPSRCFTSVRQAERAGFRVAALRHGDREIDGVYLIAAPAGVHAYCKRAAQRFKRTILCPRLLPASLTPGTCEGPGCF